MVVRNTIVGTDLFVVGITLAGLGYILAQSIPIAAIGVNLAILGALILLIVPEPIPQDAYKAILSDSISNIEIILEESHLEERAYFIPTRGKESADRVRAFIPATAKQREVLSRGSRLQMIESLSASPGRFVTDYGNQLVGLLLIPPGNEIARLSKVQVGDDLEESLRSCIVAFSDLASSVMALEEKEGEASLVKVNVKDPKLVYESPFFNKCLGSPLSCIASCVIAQARGKAVRLVDEKFEKNLLHATLEII
ncbi:MAG TPA: hypothetical protein VJN71_10400 [Nitrososphaerales archaeon]|nr:hypothetical protein [Nitrososphaerales archaeon]